ncbi:unnamed protein product [Cuscuta campestris]|uniref:Uncharacterized protein n=1 Tax=Cuscuta campestris TaxID=132261 RepID=A0A484LYW2_9ASTE|nr:unnamed protein product [Cuscuta campestris]
MRPPVLGVASLRGQRWTFDELLPFLAHALEPEKQAGGEVEENFLVNVGGKIFGWDLAFGFAYVYGSWFWVLDLVLVMLFGAGFWVWFIQATEKPDRWMAALPDQSKEAGFPIGAGSTCWAGPGTSVAAAKAFDRSGSGSQVQLHCGALCAAVQRKAGLGSRGWQDNRIRDLCANLGVTLTSSPFGGQTSINISETSASKTLFQADVETLFRTVDETQNTTTKSTSIVQADVKANTPLNFKTILQSPLNSNRLQSIGLSPEVEPLHPIRESTTWPSRAINDKQTIGEVTQVKPFFSLRDMKAMNLKAGQLVEH